MMRFFKVYTNSMWEPGSVTRRAYLTRPRMKLWLALVACSGGNPPKRWAERPHRAHGLDAIKVFRTSGAGKGKVLAS